MLFALGELACCSEAPCAAKSVFVMEAQNVASARALGRSVRDRPLVVAARRWLYFRPFQQIRMITLCDRRCCTSHEERNIDVHDCIGMLRRGLRGLSYLGMLEPAYYVNVCEGTHVHGKRMVSWHLHLIAWGEARKKLRKRIDRLNDKRVLLPIADGLAAAHQKRISKGKLASKIAYVLKAPKKAYRLFKREFITADGEVICTFRQKKADFRPGERLTVFRLMQDMYLDQLAVAGGEGTDMLRRIKRRALQELRD